MHTSAISGTVSTQNFGDKFDADKVDMNTYIIIFIYPPKAFKNSTNGTFHLEIQKISMTNLSIGDNSFDTFYFYVNSEKITVDAEETYIQRNLTQADMYSDIFYIFQHKRKVITQDELDMMI